MTTPFFFHLIALSMLFFLSTPCPVFSLQLSEKMRAASPGDYAVIHQHRHYTLLHVHSCTDSEIVFEEISAPAHQIDLATIEWKEWVQKRAPGHTSWILYAIERKQNRVTECFSLTRRAHLSKEAINGFFSKLLRLNLTLVPFQQRLQRSAPQKAGEVGQRKVWGPPLYVDGHTCQTPTYDVFHATWPRDGSKLSERTLVFYFDAARPRFPFPVWIQTHSGPIKFKMHAIDSGSGLTSPQKELPRRLPTFASAMKEDQHTLLLTLHAPLYYANFALYAIDTAVAPRKTHAIPFTFSRKSEVTTLLIDKKELENQFTPGHTYLWLAVPEERHCYAEHPHLFTWVPPTQESEKPAAPKLKKQAAQNNGGDSLP